MSVELINPANERPLQRQANALADGNGASFPIIRGIPRICQPSNYADSFGKQWNRFRLTQLDAEGQALSRQRFFAETGWSPEQIAGADVLEVGSGAGRFTRVMLEHTSANLYSVDYSNAVQANLTNNREIANGRLHLFQASIYDLPFADGSFDKVFCLGVLQHTPSVEASVRALIGKAKKGGEIVVDFYPVRGWWTKLNAKYLLRPVTRRMPHERLLRLIEANAGWLVAAHKSLTKMRLGVLTRFLPVVDLRTIPANLTPEQQREWAILDTFDMFSPEHDHPQRLSAVAEMFRRNGADVTFAGFVGAGTAQAAVVRAVRR
ncbi:MAG TPA: class I SAM-dependent methyltransferase [Sphingomicrobium sp.]|nr:class I SAM-dependent methyltransferase [Sphingomicrobium sp.]